MVARPIDVPGGKEARLPICNFITLLDDSRASRLPSDEYAAVREDFREERTKEKGKAGTFQTREGHSQDRLDTGAIVKRPAEAVSVWYHS